MASSLLFGWWDRKSSVVAGRRGVYCGYLQDRVRLSPLEQGESRFTLDSSRDARVGRPAKRRLLTGQAELKSEGADDIGGGQWGQLDYLRPRTFARRGAGIGRGIS